MAESWIEYKLDLIVRLVDTTTGELISERQVLFLEEGNVLLLLERGTGTYILLNHGRKDTKIEVRVTGYEPETAEICYEQLNKNFPTFTFYLMPMARASGFVDVLSLEGTLPGIEAVEAADLNRPLALISGYVARQQTIGLIAGKAMEEEAYAMVHPGTGRFETFRIAKRPDKLHLKVAKPLMEECAAEEPIARIIRGKVYPGGKYLLRIRAQGGTADYLIRYVVNGETRFRKIDFYSSEERRLV